MVICDIGDEEWVVGVEIAGWEGKGREVTVGAEQGEELGRRNGLRGGGWCADCEDAKGVGEEEGFFEGELEVFLIYERGGVCHSTRVA